MAYLRWQYSQIMFKYECVLKNFINFIVNVYVLYVSYDKLLIDFDFDTFVKSKKMQGNTENKILSQNVRKCNNPNLLIENLMSVMEK